MVGEVREYDELAGIYEKLDTVRIPTSRGDVIKHPGHTFGIFKRIVSLFLHVKCMYSF